MTDFARRDRLRLIRSTPDQSSLEVEQERQDLRDERTRMEAAVIWLFALAFIAAALLLWLLPRLFLPA
jgi:type VI protein secretion system component VasF